MPSPLFLHICIDLNKNDTCSRITFPFITAVDKSNATYNTIDHTARGEKSAGGGKAPLKSTTHPLFSRCNVIDDFMDKLNNKNGTNARGISREMCAIKRDS